MKQNNLIPKIAIASGVISLIALLLLHFLSPELNPTWHMVSEYAYGRYEWVLTIFFFSWAVSYWFSAMTLWHLVKNWLYKLGAILIFVSGVGALMGGIYDVRQSLHGFAFAIGVPFIPLVAPIITSYLRKRHNLGDRLTTYLSHMTWITFILMAVTMMSYLSQMQAVGTLDMNTPQLLTSLPEGVNSIIGISNRLLVISYLGWLISINRAVILQKKIT